MATDAHAEHEQIYSEEAAAQYLRSPVALIPQWVRSQNLEAVRDTAGTIIGFTRDALVRFAQRHSFKTLDEFLS